MQQDANRGGVTAESALVEGLGGRSIVLVGLMGAGKTSVGKRLAARLHLPFVDADAEIEKAADATIPEIFARHGEAYFRDGERRVIRRAEPPGEIRTSSMRNRRPCRAGTSSRGFRTVAARATGPSKTICR